MTEVDDTRARDLERAYQSPRFRSIDRLDRYVCGTQYEGRPNWWTAVNVPLAEREPCVVYPIARIARDSYIDLVLGEHRFPSIKITGVDAKKLRKVLRRARFEAVTREALASGIGSGSGAVIAGIRADRPFLDTVPAKWCRPEFDADQRTVTKLEIEYPYVVEEIDPGTRQWVACAYLFRREIDADRDVTYKPWRIVEKGQEPTWVEDKARSVDHGLGYCPVVWYPFMRGATIECRFDGHALHEHLLDEITAHDLSLSQRQRAAFTAGDPQWTETGVDPGYNPSAPGRQMRVPATPQGGEFDGRPKAFYVDSGGETARKKGPGHVWQYPDPLTKVELHQLAAGALDAIDKNSRDLRLKLCDALAYVPLDADTVPLRGLSGKAIEALKEKQLARCDYIRDDVADALLIPLLAMVCRINGLRDSVDVEHVTIKWPPYYRPDAEDRSKELKAETDATTATSAYVKNPKFDRVAKKRLAALVLDGAPEGDVEEVLDAIDAEPDAAPEPAPGQVPPPQGGGPQDSGPAAPAADPAKSASPPAASSPAPKAGIKDPGGTGSALLAKQMAQASADGGPSGLSKAQAHTPTLDADAHLRASVASPPAFNPGVAETVYSLLKDDYPDKAIDWLRDPDLVESIEGPRLVPTSQIDFTNEDAWGASDEDLSSYVDKISEGHLKPIVLVNEPNDEKLMIVDGHHRGLSYEKLGKPAMAYVVHTKTVGDPRIAAMHSMQSNGNGDKLTSQQKA